MKRALFLIMAVLSLMIAGTPTIMAAQTVDVQAVGKAVEAKSPKSVLKALQKPPSKSELPSGFTAAQVASGAGATPTAGGATPMATPSAEGGCTGAGPGVIAADTVPGAVGTVSYCVTGDSSVLGGLASVNTINYIALNPQDVTPNLLDEIQKGAAGGASQGMTIKKTTLGGVDALLLDYSEKSGSTYATVNMYIVPVGNFVVIGLVTIADTQKISASSVRKPAQELTLAGIQHLGKVAKTA